MKKKNYYWSFMIAVIMAVISVGFVSCGDDDDDDSVSNKAIGKAPAGVVAVDLGLPSGTKWANMNVGAEKPEDYGLYFAWGETTGYAAGTSHSFDWDSYKWYNGSINTKTKYSDTVDNKTILDPEDDAAHFNWGGLWYMPTGEDVRELKKNTTSKWTTVNGVYGCELTSKVEGYTDKSIFLPATGYLRGSSLYDQGSQGYFWSSTLSKDKDASFLVTFLSINRKDDDVATLNWARILGVTVRPVLKKQQ